MASSFPETGSGIQTEGCKFGDRLQATVVPTEKVLEG